MKNIAEMHPERLAIHKRWAKEISEYGTAFLASLSGRGKSAQAVQFAEARYHDFARFSVAEPDFFAKAEAFRKAHLRTRTKTLLIVDDIQLVRTPAEQSRLLALLSRDDKTSDLLHFFLLSRAKLPDFLVPLRISHQLHILYTEDLTMSQGQLLHEFSRYARLRALPEPQREALAQQVFAATDGIAVGVDCFLQHLCETPTDFATVQDLAYHDVLVYFNQKMFAHWPSHIVSAVLQLSVFDTLNAARLNILFGSKAQEIIQEINALETILTFTSPDKYEIDTQHRRYLNYYLRKLPVAERAIYYETAGAVYEAKRDLVRALECYHAAGHTQKALSLALYLSEIADGSQFAETSETYLRKLCPEDAAPTPALLGARAMLSAYRMHPEESKAHLNHLLSLSATLPEQAAREEAFSVYMRSIIACPYASSAELKQNMLQFSAQVPKREIRLDNIMTTGNMPSLINGGLDLLAWETDDELRSIYAKQAIEQLFGAEGVGVWDTCQGEFYYEQNENTKALTYLSTALSDVAMRGSIRVHYAITGIMARLFTSEGALSTAKELITNIYHTAQDSNFHELLPNITASMLQCHLLENNTEALEHFMQQHAPNEHSTFYITTRFRLLRKAQVYLALGCTLDALFVISLLDTYAEKYHRTYLRIELDILRAITLFRRGETWQAALLQALQMAHPYRLRRIFADQGAALLPLWDALRHEDFDLPAALAQLPSVPADTLPCVATAAAPITAAQIADDMAHIAPLLRNMAAQYPDYLKAPQQESAVQLSKKELAVLAQMALGHNNTKIAAALGVNLGTVKFHVSNILKKLGAENRTIAVKHAEAQGII